MIKIIFIIISFFSMEAIAWLAHKYLMHGFLWHLHEDHHKKDITSFFEKNDYFFLIFATPGIVCLVLGSFISSISLLLYIGIGITLYGFAYFLVHDIFIHQRFKIFKKTNNAYLRAIRRAHKMHHKHLEKEEGECFGMLLVPIKYLKEEIKNKK